MQLVGLGAVGLKICGLLFFRNAPWQTVGCVGGSRIKCRRWMGYRSSELCRYIAIQCNTLYIVILYILYTYIISIYNYVITYGSMYIYIYTYFDVCVTWCMFFINVCGFLQVFCYFSVPKKVHLCMNRFGSILINHQLCFKANCFGGDFVCLRP